MIRREEKETDQQDMQNAYDQLIKLIKLNKGKIEKTIWASAMIAALVDAFEMSDIPFHVCKKEINKSINHYKY